MGRQFLPVAGPLDDDLEAGVGQAVQSAVSEDGVVEEAELFLDAAIAGDDEAGYPVSADDQLVEVGGLLGGEAVDRTGMDQITIEDRTRLLSDNGPGYVSRALRDYLGMVGIKHILATPFHPQTNGKLERYHQTLKRDVNQLPYELPADLEAAIVAFVSYYNYRRYHKALGNVTPSDVLRGRRENILRRRKEVQAQTIQRRRRHNRALRELTRPQSGP